MSKFYIPANKGFAPFRKSPRISYRFIDPRSSPRGMKCLRMKADIVLIGTPSHAELIEVASLPLSPCGISVATSMDRTSTVLLMELIASRLGSSRGDVLRQMWVRPRCMALSIVIFEDPTLRFTNQTIFWN